jgi:hypothetical protein
MVEKGSLIVIFCLSKLFSGYVLDLRHLDQHNSVSFYIILLPLMLKYS